MTAADWTRLESLLHHPMQQSWGSRSRTVARLLSDNLGNETRSDRVTALVV
jgi:hypothetical protein